MDDPLERLLALRLHERDGRRSPHKPLLALLALGRLLQNGSSALPWDEAEPALADLLAEFGSGARTGRAQSAAYPFTRMRSDGVWQLSADVPMDRVGPLRETRPYGRFSPDVEQELVAAPGRALATARALVTSHFPGTLVPDVLVACGLDPDQVVGGVVVVGVADRHRSAAWRREVVQAWQRQCAFCGYDGHLGNATVGLDAAHVRWWAFDGPDTPDNGLALCALHHKLFDRGVLGLDDEHRVLVSPDYTARTRAGAHVQELAGIRLQPRPGASLPAAEHVAWHAREVFKGLALAG